MKLSRLALAIALAPGLALASEPTDFDQQLKLPALVVTSGRQVEQRAEASAAVSVFTREDIERLQPSSVAELLKRVPGVQIGQTGGRGSTTGIYLRGTKTAQTLVLVDGQRINGADNGSAALQHLSVDQIERIEVSRGANSVNYGADAIGGVIQIFTRRASGEGLHPRLRLGYGSRGTWERSLGLSGGHDRTRFSLNASSEETNGINRTDHKQGPDSDHDAYRNNALSLSLSHSFDENIKAGLTVLDQRGETEYDGFSLAYDEFQLSNYSGFIDAQINAAWESRIELGHTESRMRNRYDDSNSASAFSTYRDSAAWLNTLTFGGGHSMLAGADWYEDKLHSSDNSLWSPGPFAEDSRWNQAVFVQHRYQGEHFSTELGLRHDKNQQYGNENTWRGALTLPVNAANQLILSYSEGFRAPSFVDLYYPGYDNPNLKPENSKSYEAQWRSQLAKATRFEASLYRTDLEDAIALDSTWTPQNVAKARINGFEASLQQELFGWQGALSLSLIDPRDRYTGHTLERRARRTLSLDLDRTFGAFSIGAGWLAVSSAYHDAQNDIAIPGYGVLGLRSSWQVTQDVMLGLKVDNILDKTYYNSLAWGGKYQEEGRTALVSMTWTPSL